MYPSSFAVSREAVASPGVPGFRDSILHYLAGRGDVLPRPELDVLLLRASLRRTKARHLRQLRRRRHDGILGSGRGHALRVHPELRAQRNGACVARQRFRPPQRRLHLPAPPRLANLGPGDLRRPQIESRSRRHANLARRKRVDRTANRGISVVEFAARVRVARRLQSADGRAERRVVSATSRIARFLGLRQSHRNGERRDVLERRRPANFEPRRESLDRLVGSRVPRPVRPTVVVVGDQPDSHRGSRSVRSPRQPRPTRTAG